MGKEDEFIELQGTTVPLRGSGEREVLAGWKKQPEVVNPQATLEQVKAVYEVDAEGWVDYPISNTQTMPIHYTNFSVAPSGSLYVTSFIS